MSSRPDPAPGQQSARWRDAASAQVRSDLDELLSAATGFAQEKLAKHGDFFPFGAAIKRDGGVKLVAAHAMVPEDELPKSVDLTALCRRALTRKRDYLRAAAVVSNSTTGERAIRIEAEHSEGIALNVLVPFTRRRFTHAVSLDPPITEQVPPRIWG